ncbi:uncharacterized protein [Macrobrachium rosenbergii]|uniref:uncharacterized protein isoform X2 n=1 Tax=Macrobrachium rosenbergii TaxID=79674 RepID=UPI0034D41916
MGNLASKRKETSFDGEDVTFDHFQVLRAIGKGSFGKVCIVQKRDSKQMFAMKYMNKTQCEAREALNNVFREIEILASLRHPFLVNLWFSFQDEEDMFMVVDLLLGGDLRYHIQQGVQFTDEAVRLYILEVASALHYLHARNIIHRDIKPDNLLLDEEGHVHLTDFNIATVLREDQLATSMSGTKPYMAPEVFECAADLCDGYSYPVDWWSLGVTAYEVRRAKRPYDIHSNTSLHDIRLMFLQPPKFSSDCHPDLVSLISQLLIVSPEERLQSLDDVLRKPFCCAFTKESVIKKKTKPPFTPPKDHLNCDPTFELEEMIIESRPLHKKKKRLSKQKSLRETQSSISGNIEGDPVLYEGMLVFNREREEARKERERREQEWQAELEESMKMSDPTGLGCSYTGSGSSTPLKQHRSRSSRSHREMLKEEQEGGGNGVEGGGGGGGGPPGGGGGGGGRGGGLRAGMGRSKSEEDKGAWRTTVTKGFSSASNSSSRSSLLSSPTECTTFSKVAVSPSNVRARIAGSPKVKVRGSIVTIESPRSSSSLTKSSTQQLKEKLKELKADQTHHGESGTDSEFSDMTQSDDLTLIGKRPPSRPHNQQLIRASSNPQETTKDFFENAGGATLRPDDGTPKGRASGGSATRPSSFPSDMKKEFDFANLRISDHSSSAYPDGEGGGGGRGVNEEEGGAGEEDKPLRNGCQKSTRKECSENNTNVDARTVTSDSESQPSADNQISIIINGSVNKAATKGTESGGGIQCRRIGTPDPTRRHSMEPRRKARESFRSGDSRRCSSPTFMRDPDAPSKRSSSKPPRLSGASRMNSVSDTKDEGSQPGC